jgi:hypothetical protein
VQFLEGIGAGIFGVVSVLIVADLTKGTGRLNITQGALSTGTGTGAVLSNLFASFVVQAAGFNVGFVTLAAIAHAATLFFALAMPELRPADRQAFAVWGHLSERPAAAAASHARSVPALTEKDRQAAGVASDVSKNERIGKWT